MNSRLVLLILPLLTSSCFTAGPSFDVGVGMLAGSLDGDAALESSGGSVVGLGDVSLESDLELGDVDYVPTLRADAGIAGFHLRGNVFDTQADGTGFLSTDFGDITAGTTVNSDTELLTAQGALTLDVVNVGFLRIAPGLGVDYFDLDLSVTDPVLGQTESLDVSGPVPMVVLDVEVDPPVVPVRIKGEFGGIAVDIDDFDGTLFDAQILLYAELPAGFELFGGYRLLQAQAEGTDDGEDFDVDLNFSGWLIGGGWRF